MTNNSLWREVSKEEKQQIKQESKALLNEFAKKLEKIKTKESYIENGSGSRPESNGWKTDIEFKETTFANAPLSEKNFIITKKGDWK